MGRPVRRVSGTRIFIDPFDGHGGGVARHEASAPPSMRGKRCIGWHGEWLVGLDETTRDCFLVKNDYYSPSPSEEFLLPLPPLPDAADGPQWDPLRGVEVHCALSSQAPADCTVVLSPHTLAPDTQALSSLSSLLYCRPGDGEWSRLPVEFRSRWVPLKGTVAGGGGKVYAFTFSRNIFVVDANSSSSSSPPRVRWSDVQPDWEGIPFVQHVSDHLLLDPRDGAAFYVRFHFNNSPRGEVVGGDVHRWRPHADGSGDGGWERVDSIGDRTFFIGGRSSCSVVSPATEAGTEPDCIHLLRSPIDFPFSKRNYGVVLLHTLRLKDMTVEVNLLHFFPGCNDETGHKTNIDQVYWAIPTSFKGESLETTTGNVVSSSEMNEEEDEQEEPGTTSTIQQSCWLDLPIDLVKHHIIPKLSFSDFLKLRAACKEWSRIPVQPTIRATRPRPLLLSIRPRARHFLVVRDAASGEEYALRGCLHGLFSDDGLPPKPIFSKNGWVAVVKGDDGPYPSIFLVHPFRTGRDEAIVPLPPMEVGHNLRAVAFSSAPGRPDFVVVAVEACRGYLKMRTWRPGEQDWTLVEFSNHDEYDFVTFVVPFNNPVFLDGEFYILARDGKLGAFNPTDMTWRVLDKPGAIQDGDDIADDRGDEVDYSDGEEEEDDDDGGSNEDEYSEKEEEEEGDEDGANVGEEEDNEEEEVDNDFEHHEIICYFDKEYCFLVERNGELLAVFRQEDRAIRVYTLDRCKMEWTKLKDGWDDDLVLFWDRRGAMAVQQHDDTYGRRRVYLPAFAKEDGAISVYSLQEGHYHPGFYGVKEQMNAIWYQPDFDYNPDKCD